MSTSFNFSSDDVHPRSWVDAFPWLTGAAGERGIRWEQEPIDQADPITRRSRLVTIADLAVQRLAGWTVSQVFPGLSGDVDLLQLGLPVRAVNALLRFDCRTSDRLSALTVGDMMAWRQVGVGTVGAILQALADVSTSLATPRITPQASALPPSPRKPLNDTWSPRSTISPVDDLRLIATWYSTVGRLNQPLIGGAVPPGTPAEVVEARQRLETLTPGNVLAEDELGRDVASLLDDALGLIDPRAAHVLSERLFADKPMTLDQLGTLYDVSRERIRQIEGKARGAMLSLISEEGPLASVAASTRDLIGTITPLDDLLELIPALTKTVELVGQPAWRLLDRLDDAYEIENDWCVVPTMSTAISLTHAQLQERADQHGVVRLDDIDLIRSTHPERLVELTASWLDYCGYVVHGDFALIRTSSVADYAAAILSAEGSPLGAQEIVDRFVFDRSLGSARNAMGVDDRFERVDRDRWALKEWGMEAYSGIRSIIRELVARSGGRARVGDVVEYITARYSVTGNSVIAYAAAPPFTTKEGFVSLAGRRTARKTPEHTRRLFRRPDAWAYRVRITTDHLRGSGSVAPVAIATILGLQAGEAVQLDSPLGPQAITWTGTQPSFGTLRRFLVAEDVPADTEVFLVIRDDGTFVFEQARDLVGSPLVDALSLVGATPTPDQEAARLSLATAIGLPEGSPTSSIIGGYRARGDNDVADLLISARQHLDAERASGKRRHRAHIDEILDLL